jgi:serine/threonine protein kinase
MASLATTFTDNYSAKQNAIDEAQRVQIAVARECADVGQDAPPYHLAELIGKGSFGRVYKATGAASGQAVAVKIISIDEGDSIQPGTSDTLGDILKEVSTLKLLSDSGAKNINTVIDTLLVGHTIWIVTEYCAGGSVSTLMRPTGGLAEQWIVPILREVAEAVSWVHKPGIFHRDIKCANVLVTEDEGVQLCDFGVAGIIKTKFDKRSTVTGTLHWMAPELFDETVSYGSEVDIWAFGSMAYEMATGLPPNARPVVDLSQFGSYLRQHCPRLTGDQYSSQLKGLVACCRWRIRLNARGLNRFSGTHTSITPPGTTQPTHSSDLWTPTKSGRCRVEADYRFSRQGAPRDQPATAPLRSCPMPNGILVQPTTKRLSSTSRTLALYLVSMAPTLNSPADSHAAAGLPLASKHSTCHSRKCSTRTLPPTMTRTLEAFTAKLLSYQLLIFPREIVQ